MHALIIANGILPSPQKVKTLAESADLIICADGGANHARRFGVVPHIILGDFDSIKPSTKQYFKNITQLFIEDQESTDLEKALRYCVERSVQSVDIIGASGDRLDHTTGNLGCFKKFGSKITIRLIDTAGELTLVQGSISIKTQKDEKLSLIPLDHCTGVTTTNLKYPLHNDILELGVREGTSNEALSTSVKISVTSGTLLLYRFTS